MYVAGRILLVTLTAVMALVGASFFASSRVPATPSHPDIAGAMVRLALEMIDESTQTYTPTLRTFCSGVHVGGGRVLTAGHCVNYRHIMVGSDNGKVLEEATLLWVSRHYDVGLLKAGFTKNEVASASLRCDGDVKVGDEVHVAGNPMGLEWMHAWGRVAGSRGSIPAGGDALVVAGGSLLWPAVIPLDVTGGPGDSGGPVYDMQGRIVGILVAGYNVPIPVRSFMYMVPASVLCELTEPA